jgi:hypothetical protein
MFVRVPVKHKVIKDDEVAEVVEVIEVSFPRHLDTSIPSTTYGIEAFSFSRSPSGFGYRGAIRVSVSTTARATR